MFADTNRADWFGGRTELTIRTIVLFVYTLRTSVKFYKNNKELTINYLVFIPDQSRPVQLPRGIERSCGRLVKWMYIYRWPRSTWLTTFTRVLYEIKKGLQLPLKTNFRNVATSFSWLNRTPDKHYFRIMANLLEPFNLCWGITCAYVTFTSNSRTHSVTCSTGQVEYCSNMFSGLRYY